MKRKEEGPRHFYKWEDKWNVLNYVFKHGKTTVEVAKMFGIKQHLVSKWKSAVIPHIEELFGNGRGKSKATPLELIKEEFAHIEQQTLPFVKKETIIEVDIVPEILKENATIIQFMLEKIGDCQYIQGRDAKEIRSEIEAVKKEVSYRLNKLEAAVFATNKSRA